MILHIFSIQHSLNLPKAVLSLSLLSFEKWPKKVSKMATILLLLLLADATTYCAKKNWIWQLQDKFQLYWLPYTVFSSVCSLSHTTTYSQYFSSYPSWTWPKDFPSWIWHVWLFPPIFKLLKWAAVFNYNLELIYWKKRQKIVPDQLLLCGVGNLWRTWRIQNLF